MVDDVRNLQRMGRRRFLSTVAALGASAGAVAGLSQSVMAELIDDPKREVPRLYSYTHANHEAVKDGAVPDRKPVYYKISRDRWRRVESAHDARGRIERRLEDRREPLDVWVTTNSNGEKRIDVDVYDDGSVGRRSVRAIEDALPTAVDGVAGRGTPAAETVRGIPVAVNRIPAASPEPTPVSNDPDYYWEDWDEIPAGAAGRFAITQDSSGDWVYGTGTLCTPVSDGGTTKMLTAGHNIDTPSPYPDTEWIAGSVPEDEEDFEPDEVNNTGDTGLDVFDAATLEPESGTQLTYEFASYSGATGGDIIGTLSEDRIKDIEDHGTSRYEIFRRQGARTGRSGGFEIDKVGGEAFRPTLDQSETDSGDSGGPYHVENVAPMAETELVAPSGVEIEWDPFSHIAGVHQGNDPDVSYTVATSMYRVEEEFGVSV